MVRHKQIYHREFDGFLCELTGRPESDVHHIDARGMGGRDSADTIDNLMALCREAHEYFGDKSKYKEWLKKRHQDYIEKRIPFYLRKDSWKDPIFRNFLKHYKKLKA